MAIAQPIGGHIGAGSFAHAARNDWSQVAFTACEAQPLQHAYVCGGLSWISSLVTVQSASVLHETSSLGRLRGAV